MNKTILVLPIVIAFIAGNLTTEPFVEAASGWKEAFQSLQNQLDAISQIRTVHLEAGTCGPPEPKAGVSALVGWCPQGSSNEFWFIEDANVEQNSVIIVSLDYANASFGPSCKVMHLLPGEGFTIRCSERGAFGFSVPPGAELNYAIMN